MFGIIGNQGDGSKLENLPAGTETDPLWSSNFTAHNTTWSIDTDTFSNASEDHLNDVKGGSTWDIPVANSIAGLKSTNRP